MEYIKSSIHIDYYEDLIQYIHSLPDTAQLRFLSTTSLRKTFGVVVVVYNEVEDYVLVIPYVRNKTRNYSLRMNIIENQENATIRCLQKEAGYELTSLPIQIGVNEVKNSKKIGDSFFKFTMLVNGYAGLLKRSEEIVSEKNLSPVWIKRKLLPYVFEKNFCLDGENHPQFSAYKDFINYYRLPR